MVKVKVDIVKLGFGLDMSSVAWMAIRGLHLLNGIERYIRRKESIHVYHARNHIGRPYVVDEGEDVETSSRGGYMAKESGGGGSNGNLKESSRSDFEGGADDDNDTCPNVSLVSERDLENMSDRRGRKKASGDGVVFGEHPLKREKCPGASIRDRCTIEHVRSFGIEQNLVLALVKCWVLHSKVFRLTDMLVPFSMFGVTLLTCLPATVERVDFDDDKWTTKSRDIGSGFLAPHVMYGTTWESQRYANDVHKMSRYAWAEAA
ncbi:hypothetical protein Cgig2_021343 [Carnegiea gigantea]|uniref:Uncharacterized protein n=1 Tax=Carnegiea gigantea TaxID=171969 RepID=A0A9Q1JMM6_9CARY|nr:hypothetical protein Cgig2_021343 [Carnegiea gigantea]